MWLPLLPLPIETQALAIIKERLCFADLPAEIRNEIYTHALVPHDNQPIILPYAYQQKPLSIREPPLLHVSRWIRAEATPIYYSCNTFEAPSPPSAQRFLKGLSPEKIGMIRRFRPVDLILPNTMKSEGSRRWFDAARANINRLVEQVGKGELRSESVFVPISGRGHGGHEYNYERRTTRWCRVGDVEGFEVVGGKEEGRWSVEWRD